MSDLLLARACNYRPGDPLPPLYRPPVAAEAARIRVPPSSPPPAAPLSPSLPADSVGDVLALLDQEAAVPRPPKPHKRKRPKPVERDERPPKTARRSEPESGSD